MLLPLMLLLNWPVRQPADSSHLRLCTQKKRIFPTITPEEFGPNSIPRLIDRDDFLVRVMESNEWLPEF